MRRDHANLLCIVPILTDDPRRESLTTISACLHFSICACHPCAGAMLIFSVSFQFLRMTGCDPGSDPNSIPHHHPTYPTTRTAQTHHTHSHSHPHPATPHTDTICARTAVPYRRPGRTQQSTRHQSDTYTQSLTIHPAISQCSNAIPSHATYKWIGSKHSQCRATITPHIQNVTKVGAMLQSASLSQ